VQRDCKDPPGLRHQQIPVLGCGRRVQGEDLMAVPKVVVMVTAKGLVPTASFAIHPPFSSSSSSSTSASASSSCMNLHRVATHSVRA